jgi:alkanesulfonate monooxygenase SsuD/methylene tetrahydromethanopterin reductase-like flavin-dependent oxidoreductase (luciferase family)
MDFKNLKIPQETHAALAKRADALGMKIYTLADALLIEGLKKNGPAIREAVANAQQSEVTPPEADTNPGLPRE